MAFRDADRVFSKGLDALEGGDTVLALACFERAARMEDNPRYNSHLAYCMAKERGQYKLAISLCKQAIAKEPSNSEHYLNLGKVYLISGQRAEAIRTFREGLSRENNRRIADELNKLGTRKPPLIPFLRRTNPINKYLGILLGTLRLR